MFWLPGLVVGMLLGEVIDEKMTPPKTPEVVLKDDDKKGDKSAEDKLNPNPPS